MHMKTAYLKFAFIVVASIFSFNMSAQNDNLVFELNASALYNDEPTANYSIIVYENGQLKDSLFMKKSKPTVISLESNKVYAVVYKKENCQDKIVIVNTEIPVGTKDLMADPFDLQVELSPEVKKVKQEYSDYPVAILTISKKKKLLMASENYHKETHVSQH